jgi:hypothetical protein
VITHLPAQTREQIDQIRTFHVPTTRSWSDRVFHRPPLCTMCGVPIGRCQLRRWADDVTAGRRTGWTP